MNQNFSIIRNRTYVITGTVTNGSQVVNLTDATLTLTAKWSAGGDTVFTCSSPSDGIVITSPSTGIFRITIASNKTSSLPIEEGFLSLPYEVLLTTSSGELYPLLYGKLVVKPNIV